MHVLRAFRVPQMRPSVLFVRAARMYCMPPVRLPVHTPASPRSAPTATRYAARPSTDARFALDWSDWMDMDMDWVGRAAPLFCSFFHCLCRWLAGLPASCLLVHLPVYMFVCLSLRPPTPWADNTITKRRR